MTPGEKAAVAAFGAALASAYREPEPLTRDGALAIVRGLLDDDRLDSRETEALEVLLWLMDCARLPELPQIVTGPPGATPCLTWQEPEHGGRCRACGYAREAHAGRVASRSFLPQGCTSEQIATAAGVAARELCVEHEPGVGVLVEVRLVRRGEQAPERPDVVANVRKARAVAEAADIREAQERVDALRAGVASYAGGDRAPSPPVRLLRELREAEAALRDLRGES